MYMALQEYVKLAKAEKQAANKAKHAKLKLEHLLKTNQLKRVEYPGCSIIEQSRAVEEFTSDAVKKEMKSMIKEVSDTIKQEYRDKGLMFTAESHFYKLNWMKK